MSQPVFLVMRINEKSLHGDFQSPELHQKKSFLRSKKVAEIIYNLIQHSHADPAFCNHVLTLKSCHNLNFW